MSLIYFRLFVFVNELHIIIMLSVCQKPCHKFLFLDFRYEALELRDGDKGMYLGKSVQRAVKNINDKISEASFFRWKVSCMLNFVLF